jgi:protein KRI1
LKARLRQIEDVCGVDGLAGDDNDDEEDTDATGGGKDKKKKKKKKDKEKEKDKGKKINLMSLDEDWDPVKHEALMQSQFNDEYYNAEDPDFAKGGKYYHPDAEDDVGEGYSAVGGWNEDYDEEDGEYHNQEGGYGENEDEDHDGELGNAEMDAELYKLDYEDIVAGIPCRFKYTTVEAEDYGLTIDDILDAKDNELNKYVGLKKISASYREARRADEQEVKLSRKRKHLREAIKQRKAEADEKQEAKLLEEAAEKEKVAEEAAAAGDDDDNNGVVKKSKRKRNKKKLIGGNLLASAGESGEDSRTTSAVVAASSEKKKRSKKQRRGGAEVDNKEAAKKRRMELYD